MVVKMFAILLQQLSSEDIAMMPGCQTNEKKKK